jgi:protein TonB
MPPPAAPEASPPPPSTRLDLSAEAQDEISGLVTGDNVIPATRDPRFNNRPPAYPRDSIDRGEAGTVLLNAHIGPDGRVLSVEILQSSGFPRLDQAAREAVARWRFQPGHRDGVPVESIFPIHLDFTLDDQGRSGPPRNTRPANVPD